MVWMLPQPAKKIIVISSSGQSPVNTVGILVQGKYQAFSKVGVKGEIKMEEIERAIRIQIGH